MARRSSTKPTPRVIDTQQRIRLPTDLMRALGLSVGDHVGFEIDGKEARLFRVTWIRETEK